MRIDLLQSTWKRKHQTLKSQLKFHSKVFVWKICSWHWAKEQKLSGTSDGNEEGRRGWEGGSRRRESRSSQIHRSRRRAAPRALRRGRSGSSGGGGGARRRTAQQASRKLVSIRRFRFSLSAVSLVGEVFPAKRLQREPSLCKRDRERKKANLK